MLIIQIFTSECCQNEIKCVYLQHKTLRYGASGRDQRRDRLAREEMAVKKKTSL